MSFKATKNDFVRWGKSAKLRSKIGLSTSYCQNTLLDLLLSDPLADGGITCPTCLHLIQSGKSATGHQALTERGSVFGLRRATPT